MNRRGFLEIVTGTTFAFHVVPRHVLGRGFTPPSEKLNIAGIGIGGQGAGVIRDMATEEISSPCATLTSTKRRPRSAHSRRPSSSAIIACSWTSKKTSTQ